MTLINETAKYSYEEDRTGSVTLTRKSDGAYAFFQGEDAGIVSELFYDLDNDEIFDAIASDYDEVMQI